MQPPLTWHNTLLTSLFHQARDCESRAGYLLWAYGSISLFEKLLWDEGTRSGKEVFHWHKIQRLRGAVVESSKCSSWCSVCKTLALWGAWGGARETSWGPDSALPPLSSKTPRIRYLTFHWLSSLKLLTALFSLRAHHLCLLDLCKSLLAPAAFLIYPTPQTRESSPNAHKICHSLLVCVPEVNTALKSPPDLASWEDAPRPRALICLFPEEGRFSLQPCSCFSLWFKCSFHDHIRLLPTQRASVYKCGNRGCGMEWRISCLARKAMVWDMSPLWPWAPESRDAAKWSSVYRENLVLRASRGVWDAG